MFARRRTLLFGAIWTVALAGACETAPSAHRSAVLASRAEEGRPCRVQPEVVDHFREVERRIVEAWVLPAGVAADNTVQVRFVLTEAGEALHVEVVHSTDPRLEQSVLDAIRAAEPLPEMSPEVVCLSAVWVFATFENPPAPTNR